VVKHFVATEATLKVRKGYCWQSTSSRCPSENQTLQCHSKSVCDDPHTLAPHLTKNQDFVQSTVLHTVLQGHIPQCIGQACFWATGSISGCVTFWVQSTKGSNICTTCQSTRFDTGALATMDSACFQQPSLALTAVLKALCMLAC